MLNQLQELDKQISDLRLDVEKTSEEHLETDSRPSSGERGGTRRNSAVRSSVSEAPCAWHSQTCRGQWSLFPIQRHYSKTKQEKSVIQLHDRATKSGNKFIEI